MENKKSGFEQLKWLSNRINELKKEKAELYRKGYKHDSEEIRRIGKEINDLYNGAGKVIGKQVLQELKEERKKLRQDPEKNKGEIQELDDQIKYIYKQIATDEKSQQSEIGVEEIAQDIERLSKSIEALEKNKAEIQEFIVNEREKTARKDAMRDLENVKGKIEQAKEEIAKQNEILERKKVEEAKRKAKMQEQIAEKKAEMKKRIEEEEARQKAIRDKKEAKNKERIAREKAKKKEKADKEKARKQEEVARRNKAIGTMKQLSKSVEDLVKEKNDIEKVWSSTKDGVLRAEIERDLTRIQEEIQHKSAKIESLQKRYSITGKDLNEKPAKLHKLQTKIGIMKPEDFQKLYSELSQELAERFRNHGELSEEEIAEILARISEIEALQKPEQKPNDEKSAKLHKLQTKIGIMKPEDFQKLYSELSQEIAERFRNPEELLEEEIAEILARISEIEASQEQLPKPKEYPGTKPNPPTQSQVPVPIPEETAIDRIGDWFADKWEKVSNFVLFKPFKWAFKGIKALGKKFMETMMLKPDDGEEKAWDGVYDVKFEELEEEEPVLPKVEAEIVEEKIDKKAHKEDEKNRKQMAREIRKILKEQDREPYEYKGAKIQNTASLKVIAEYLEGKRKIEGKGRLITPEEGDYQLRLKPDGNLEPDYDHPLKKKLVEGVEIDYSSIAKEGIDKIKVDENWKEVR